MAEGASSHALRSFNQSLKTYLRYNKRETGRN